MYQLLHGLCWEELIFFVAFLDDTQRLCAGIINPNDVMDHHCGSQSRLPATIG